MLFTGNHPRTLDEKNRLQIPADFRAEILSESKRIGSDVEAVLYFTPGPLDNTLSIYTRNSLEALIRRISTDTVDSPEAQAFELFYSLVERVEMDKQGRLVMPQSLLAARSLGKELTLAGQVHRIDVWRTDEFAEAVKTRFATQWPALQRFLRRSGPGVGENGNDK